MKRLRVDVEKCTGCLRCMIVCSAVTRGKFQPSRASVHVITFPRDGISIPLVCYQCESAPCVSACPVDSLKREPKTGAIVVDESLCTACGACEDACPYGMIEVLDGVAVSCDLCGGDPKCVSVCVPQAIVFEEEGEFRDWTKEIIASGEGAGVKKERRALAISEKITKRKT